MKHYVLLLTMLYYSTIQPISEYEKKIREDRISRFGSFVCGTLSVASLCAFIYIAMHNQSLEMNIGEDSCLRFFSTIKFPGVNLEDDEKISGTFYATLGSISLLSGYTSVRLWPAIAQPSNASRKP